MVNIYGASGIANFSYFLFQIHNNFVFKYERKRFIAVMSIIIDSHNLVSMASAHVKHMLSAVLFLESCKYKKRNSVAHIQLHKMDILIMGLGVIPDMCKYC